MVKYEKSVELEEKIKDWKNPFFSDDAIKILKKRYLRKDDSGKVIELPKEMLYRVAHVISSVDDNYKDFNSETSEREFYHMMAEGKFLPNSPTLKGAGEDINLAACYVLPVEDSREGIFKEGLYNAISVQAFGGGTGFNFSKLRPKGSSISTTKGVASGPVSFIRIFDLAIGPVIAQGGTRNGANMAILNYDHPEIEAFVDSKINGEINNFNISVGVTEEFMKKVFLEETYFLEHPKYTGNKKVNAKKLFDKIIHNAWLNGDPGIIFLDRLDQYNPTPHIGKIESTNPCGEQPLLPMEACNLGSINLGKFVKNREIDYDSLRETVHSSVHFLDNVIDVCNYPLRKSEKEKKELEDILNNAHLTKDSIESILDIWSQSPIEKAVKGNRKIGLGVMGFADILFGLGIPYGSEKSFEIAEQVMKFINEESKKASINLAKTRGKFPNWDGSIYDPNSKYFKGENLELRNATTTTIAPTGTLSILLKVNGGIEPLFAIAYDRRSLYDQTGDPTLEFIVIDDNFNETAKKEGFYSEELFKEILKNYGSIKGMEKPKGITNERWSELQRLFTTAHDLSIEEHIKIQVAFQKYTDNAVSKTINLPMEATEENVMEAYTLAYKMGIKGVTVYRDKSKKNQVLSLGKDKKIVYIQTKDRPDELEGATIRKKTGCGNLFITRNYFRGGDGDKILFEAFAQIGKGGGCASSQNEAIGRLVSMLLRSSADPLQVASQLIGVRCHKQCGFGEDAIYSCSDAIGKSIAEFMGKEIKTEIEDSENFEDLISKNKENNTQEKNNPLEGEACPECGCFMEQTGGCKGGRCSNPTCGYSSCG